MDLIAVCGLDVSMLKIGFLKARWLLNVVSSDVVSYSRLSFLWIYSFATLFEEGIEMGFAGRVLSRLLTHKT